jgi:hypothetical protein
MATVTLVELRSACIEFLRRIDAGEVTEDTLGVVLEEAKNSLNDVEFREWRRKGTGDGS